MTSAASQRDRRDAAPAGVNAFLMLWLVRTLAAALSALLIGTAAMLLIELAFEPLFWSSVYDRVIGSVFTIAAYTALLLFAALIMRRGRLVPLMLFTMPCSLIALWLFMNVIWKVEPLEAMLYVRTAGLFTLVALASVHTGFMVVLRTRDPISLLLKIGLSLSMWCAAVMLFMMALDDVLVPLIWNTGGRQLLIGCGIVTVLGTIFVPIVISARNRRAAALNESVAERLKIDLTCPVCGSEQRLRTGPTRCGSCGTLMRIELEEPRCDCGYQLYRLQADACPECGRAIPPEKRWEAPEAVTPGTADTAPTG